MFHRVKLDNQDNPEEQENAAMTSAEEQQASDEAQEETQESEDASSSSDLDIPAASYQTSQPAPAARQTYAKPYQSPAPYKAPSPAAAESSSQAENDRRLTIGRGITMSGEIESCDYLLVEGTVEAALKGASALNIAQSGTFYGTVEIEEAVIAGRFEGEITVNGRLTIRSSGVITGTIAYKELEVEAGAVIDGRLTPVSSMASSSKDDKVNAGAKASKSAKPAKTATPKAPANSDGELFPEEKVTAAE